MTAAEIGPVPAKGRMNRWPRGRGNVEGGRRREDEDDAG